MTRAALTRHAIDRAMTRWLEPTEASAAQAIRYVLTHGAPVHSPRGHLIRCGSRQVVIRDGVVATVHLHKAKVTRALARKARQDLRERAHRGWRP